MPSHLSSLEGAIWGQFVGDAAGLGTHWIYDLEALGVKYPAGIQGFEAPSKGHYHEGKQPGDQTHYGDSALLLLESLAACGEFREMDFGLRFEGFFNGPTCKTYKDHATRETLAHLVEQPGNYQNGADDDQMATITRLAPVVICYHQSPESQRLDAIRRLTRVTQNHGTAEACCLASAVLLQHLLNGVPFRDAFETTRKSAEVSCDGSDYFEFAHMLREMDVITATGRFGQSCPLPQSFPSALHAAWTHHDDFSAAILSTLSAGGDNAGRAAMIGAWLGATLGIEAIPEEWRMKLRNRERIEAALRQWFDRLIE
jgi:ADP-ribosylglycohydrolase